MDTGFLNHLTVTGAITPEQSQALRRNMNLTESWIGRLMVHHRLVDADHVDQILNRQDLYGGFFGENAIDLGYITREQLDALLKAQDLRRDVEIIETLALTGVLPFDDALSALREYHAARGRRLMTEQSAPAHRTARQPRPAAGATH